ncbi:Helix-turn-helix domain-containing protein [Cohaesibacter sp. ES.047]|uniref:helix-turn-helix domain-containing protein n=1 Tax=Cohaesibacter sp. ES.047 TaxID=1798205 RepID=UPI000BB8C5B9|nr:helix-turn-helix transcriptional regulator [Cohaesibacter sp. ES.047]SNY90508.1 Helix-turn-helix domain-containing protein [Cohaesibacter sp. ES.047]
MTPFGAKLRRMRRARNISLKEMADRLDVSSAYLSALEHGKRGKPTWFLIQRIIAYFNVIWDEAEELQRLAEISDPNPTVRTAGLDPRATELANLLAERIGQLSGDSLDSLILQLRAASTRDRALGSPDLRDQL